LPCAPGAEGVSAGAAFGLRRLEIGVILSVVGSAAGGIEAAIGVLAFLAGPELGAQLSDSVAHTYLCLDLE